MSKIFPHRRLNPTKCRLDPPSPPAKPISQEDKHLLRELQREAVELSLARRAARLVPPPAEPPAVPHVTMDFIEPEFIQAFETLPRGVRSRLLAMEPDKYKPVQAAIPWLDAYSKRAPASCEGCGIEITISQVGALLNNRVPYEVVAVGPQPYRIGGLCENCFKLSGPEKSDKIALNMGCVAIDKKERKD